MVGPPRRGTRPAIRAVWCVRTPITEGSRAGPTGLDGPPFVAIGNFTSTRAELKEAIASYQKLIANYTLSRERLRVRRRGGGDSVMLELDERMKANQRTIDTLQRAIEVAREQLKTIERG